MPLAHNQGWLQSVMSEEGGRMLEGAFEVLREFFFVNAGDISHAEMNFCAEIL